MACKTDIEECSSFYYFCFLGFSELTQKCVYIYWSPFGDVWKYVPFCIYDWLIDCWVLTSEQQYFSYIPTMNMKLMIKWTWNDDKKGWDTRTIGLKNWIATRKKEGWARSGNLDSCGGAQRFLLLSNTTARFFNVRGTWHLSKHGAPLWLTVRFSVL